MTAREAETVEWIVGINAVSEVVRSRPRDILRLEVVPAGRGRRAALASDARAAGIPVTEVNRGALERRFDAPHQGVAARVRPRAPLGPEALAALVAAPDALVLVLDQVQDPRNFGACLRSARAAGADAVVFPKARAAALTPAARKAAAGAAEALALVQVTNLAAALIALKEAGVWLVGADGAADQPLWQVDLRGRIALVLGSEGRGLRRLTREHCDFLVRVPMAPGAESLNVSVAAGVFLFEALRQRTS